MVTADGGKFEFTGVPAGKYRLSGARRGFITASYDEHFQFNTAIVTGASVNTEELVLKLQPEAIISGQILDEASEPVRHASVNLYEETHDEGFPQMRSVRGAQTNDLGEYEAANLMPGSYYLSVSAQPWYAVHPPSQLGSKTKNRAPTEVSPALDVAYPVTYSGDTSDSDTATPIVIRGGERVRLDVHLNPVPALRLVFPAPPGQNSFIAPQIERSSFDGVSHVQISGMRRVDNLWEVTGVPAGRYNIRFQSGSGTAVQMNGVELTQNGQTIDPASAQPLSHVKISVQAPGEPEMPKKLSVGLSARLRSLSRWASTDAKGEAEFQDISAGRYEVTVGGGGKRYSVSRILADGAEVSGHTLTIAPGSSPSVTLTVVSGSVELEGAVKHAGKPFAGAMVVLVPKNPGDNRDLFRRDQSDLDGTFTLANVVPGSYTLLAIDDGWDLNWSEPEVIAAYVKHGRKIEVGGQNLQPVKLADIQVQPR